jgi:hypothetical protein
MNVIGFLFLLITSVAILRLPRSWAPLPLLMAACYITFAQVLMVGPFHFTIVRVLVLLGVLRALARRERLPGGLNRLDWVMIMWGTWEVFASVFHRPFGDALVLRLGIAYNTLGIYFLMRMFCQGTKDIVQIIQIIAFLLVPVAMEMANEKGTGRNLFAMLGGISEVVEVRDGKLRAAGPFGHAILAGTVGAMCIPLMIGVWRQNRVTAVIGLVAASTMVISSTSSGPLMSVMFGLLGLGIWRWRHLTGRMRIAAVIGYILLDLVMKDPAYFLFSRIDLTGSSTGWHRVELIRSASRHLNEWWFAGTDYTRHWMINGLPSMPSHCDITNHYLAYGVSGGLPLMILFICALWVAFSNVGQYLELRAEAPFPERFLVWSVGANLFAHTITCFSVSYFDQSIVFLCVTLGILGSLPATAAAAAEEESDSEGSPDAFQDERDVKSSKAV